MSKKSEPRHPSRLFNIIVIVIGCYLIATGIIGDLFMDWDKGVFVSVSGCIIGVLGIVLERQMFIISRLKHIEEKLTGIPGIPDRH